MVVEQAASSTPIETLAADGVAYSWAEFESYYFDADMAAEIWEVAEVVAAPEPTPEPSPLSFVLGSHHSNRCTTFSVHPTVDADDPCAGPTISLAQGKRITQATGMVWPN